MPENSVNVGIGRLIRARDMARESGDLRSAAELDALIQEAQQQGAEIEVQPGAAEQAGELVSDVAREIVYPAAGAAAGAALMPVIAPAIGPAAALAPVAGLYGGHMAGGKSAAGAAGATILDLVGGRLLEKPARGVVRGIGALAGGAARVAGKTARRAGEGIGDRLSTLYTDTGRLAPRGAMAETGGELARTMVGEVGAGRQLRTPTRLERRAMAEAFEQRTGARYTPGPVGETAEAMFANMPTTARYIEQIHSQRARDLDEMAERLFGDADPESVGDLVAEWASEQGRRLLQRENEIWERVADGVPDSPEVRQRIAQGLVEAVERADPSGRLSVVHPLLQSREAVNARRAMLDVADQIATGELPTSAPVYLDQLRRDVAAKARDILERSPGSERARRLQALAKELEGVQKSLLDPETAAAWERASRDYAAVKSALDDLHRYMPDMASGDIPDAARHMLRDLRGARAAKIWRAAERLAAEAGDDTPLRELSGALIADAVANSANTTAFVKALNKLPREIRQALPPDAVETALLYSSFREIAGTPARMAVTPGGGQGRATFGALAYGLANALGAAGTAMIRSAEREALEAAAKGRAFTLSDAAKSALRDWATDVVRFGAADAARVGLAKMFLGEAEAAEPQQGGSAPQPAAATTEPRPASLLDIVPTREPVRVRADVVQAQVPPRQLPEYAQPTAATTAGPVSVLELMRGPESVEAAEAAMWARMTPRERLEYQLMHSDNYALPPTAAQMIGGLR